MTDVKQESPVPITEPARPHFRVVLAAGLVTAVFILSNSPTPLYVQWQARLGFASGMLTVIFTAYIVGLLVALLVAGQLSDQIGRKKVILPGLIVALIACILFATATSVPMLLVARFLTGMAVGVIVSAGMATVVDVGGSARKQRSALAASVAMVFGAGLGPLLAGVLAQFLSNPIPIIFGIEFIVLGVSLVIAIILPVPALTIDKTRLPQIRLHLPSVPTANRRHLAFGIAVFGPGITATSFVLSLGPSLLSDQLGVTSPLIAGGTACVMFLAATGVQFAVKSQPIRRIFLMGATATILAMMSMTAAINLSTPLLLIVSAILSGAGQGLGQLGGLTLIGVHVPANRRAEANAVFNIGGYIPAGLLTVVSGYTIDWVGMPTATALFAVILIAAAAVAATHVYQRLPRHERA